MSLPSSRPVCLLGFGRSGTSLAARVVNLLGVDLGSEQTMLPPDDLNPKGYWEQHEVMKLNDEILAALGGRWCRPPSRPSGWEAAPEMEPFRERIAELAQRFDGRRWGFKDPRTTLTLPIWRSVLGELDYVICLRDPVEVLAPAVDGAVPPDVDPVAVWLHYSCEALRLTTGRRRAFVFYERWSEDPLKVSRDLAVFLNGVADTAALERIAATFDPALYRQRAGEGKLAERDGLPVEARTMHRLARDLAAAEQRGEVARAHSLQALACDLDRELAERQR